MDTATVVIPNLNGMKYLADCLDSLRKQTHRDFRILMIDNGSVDGSADFTEAEYPEVQVVRFPENRGFCGAVNEGIRRSDTTYVILLNNDTICEPEFVNELVTAMEEDRTCFSCASRMVQMTDASLIDNAGDYYCALGWAFAMGKGRPAVKYAKKRKIFSACAGAAIYRREIFDEIGLFDEIHFAYLEDVDVAYRARIYGYHNLYIPGAVVHHVGSATSGSVYNDFKIRHAARNSVYLVYKNMPFLQILLNLPLLFCGFFIKMLFFARKGFLKEYVSALGKGIALCSREKKVRFTGKHLPHYLEIQLELWVNIFRRFGNF